MPRRRPGSSRPTSTPSPTPTTRPSRSQPGDDLTADEWEGLRTLYARRAPRFLATALPGLDPARVRFVAHHVAHAASATFASGFDPCACSCSTAAASARRTWPAGYDGGPLEVLAAQALPHSLGLLYEELTAHLGFRRSSDEYKVMAMASYGEPAFLDELRELVRADGRRRLPRRDVDWPRSRRRWRPARSGRPRTPTSPPPCSAGSRRSCSSSRAGCTSAPATATW